MKWPTGNIFLEGQVDFDVFLPRMEKWFWSQLQALYAVPAASGRGVLMGAPLWGDDFIDRFLAVCLPTLKATKNFEALKDNSRLVLYTDGEGFKRLWRMARDLTTAGLHTQVVTIPHEIMELVYSEPKHERYKVLNKYWVLGTVQNLSIQMAGRLGLGFHMLMPDHVYAHEYFPNMFRLAEQWEGIAQTSISGDVIAALPDLEPFRAPGGRLEVPDRDLGDIAWRHLHKQTQANLMNGHDLQKELPDSHLMVWKGRDKVYLYCCHLNAAWLSPDVCRRAPVRLYNALDTELPAFMPEDLCIPEAEDGMTFVELSDDTKLHQTSRVPFHAFAMRCWTTVHFRTDYLPFFEMASEVPIKEQAEFMDDAVIKKHHRTLFEALKSVHEPLHKMFKEVGAKHDAAAEAAKKRVAEDHHEPVGNTDPLRLPERRAERVGAG